MSKFYSVFWFSSVIEQLGGKQTVMQLLAHDDPNVRYEALLAVQKLMVHNWYDLHVLSLYLETSSFFLFPHQRLTLNFMYLIAGNTWEDS